MRQPYPLQWPAGWARTPPEKRERALFRVSLAEGIQDLLYELRLMLAAGVVITSDLPTTSKGLPYASGKCDDPGVAVWCVINRQERVFACDRWTTPAANLRAIGKTVEALRGIENWGAADMVTRAFSGFAALPPGGEEMAPNPASTKRPWRDVLGLSGAMSSLGRNSTPAYLAKARAYVKEAYREAIVIAHPDAGGSHERAAELGEALAAAEAEISRAEQGGA